MFQEDIEAFWKCIVHSHIIKFLVFFKIVSVKTINENTLHIHFQNISTSETHYSFVWMQNFLKTFSKRFPKHFRYVWTQVVSENQKQFPFGQMFNLFASISVCLNKCQTKWNKQILATCGCLLKCFYCNCIHTKFY